MIRTNLIVSKLDAADQKGGVYIAKETIKPEQVRALIVKLFLIVVFTSGLKLYEDSNIAKLQKQRNVINAKISELEVVLKKLQAFSEETLESQKKIQNIEKKIQIVHQLSKVRLREIKALDSIQSIVPEKVWLSNISYNGSEVTMSGGAIDGSDLASFIEFLEENVLFKNIILKQSQIITDSRGTYEQFSMTLNLGVVN